MAKRSVQTRRKITNLILRNLIESAAEIQISRTITITNGFCVTATMPRESGKSTFVSVGIEDKGYYITPSNDLITYEPTVAETVRNIVNEIKETLKIN